MTNGPDGVKRSAASMILCLSFSVATLFLHQSARAKRASPSSTDPKSASESINRFALDLYKTLGNDSTDSNLFFSPLSIETALMMTYAGAKGETAREMATVLHLGQVDASVHRSFGRLLARLRSRVSVRGNALSVANALWGDSAYRFLSSYTGLIRRSYGGFLTRLDFAKAPQAARKRINRWVERATARRIKDLLPDGSVTSDTRLVLTNAVYFKGRWHKPFKKQKTEESTFSTNGNGKVPVKMMFQKGKFRYRQGKDAQVLELPYRGGKLSMVFILPNRGKKLADLEAVLSAPWLSRQIAQLAETKVMVYIPRYTTTLPCSLRRPLQAMGMKTAFMASKADFTGMSGNVAPEKRLSISQVLHKAFVAVDEQGTEAAAATAVIAVGAGFAPRIPIFQADHPFVFLIRDIPTNTILFLGRLNDPSKS